MKVHKIKIGKDTYHLAEQSAEVQLELYEILAGGIYQSAAASMLKEIDVDFLIGFLVSLKKNHGTKISEIGELVLYKTFKKDSEVLVDIKDFQGNTQNYIQLVAEGVKRNLSSFFPYLSEQIMQLEKQMEQAQEKMMEDVI